MTDFSRTERHVGNQESSTDKNLGHEYTKEALGESPPDNSPFGDEGNTEVKYRVMKWWHCGLLMTAQSISLGILSLPSAVATLGIAPAVVLILFVSALSCWTGLVIYQFKQRYPHIHSMADAGEILMGRVGREILGFGQLLFLIFLMSSHILTFSVLMNELTDHGACTIAFAVVGLVASFLGALPRTFGKVYGIAIISFSSIFIAIIFTMVAIGVQNPHPAPVDITTKVPFSNAFLAFTNILFAYTAHVTFFGFISEMEQPRDFPKSLAMFQTIETVMYTVTSVVIYYYAGPTVSSPALSSAGSLMKKIAYGLSIPTVIFAGVIMGHSACKYIYVRLFRGSAHLHNNGFASIGAWVAIAFGVWTVAWIIAESVPVFNDLLSLIRSLFGSWFSYGLPAVFGLVLNRGKWFASPTRILMTVLNIAILAIACAICGLGLYVSGKSIHNNSASASWTCANNVG